MYIYTHIYIYSYVYTIHTHTHTLTFIAKNEACTLLAAKQAAFIQNISVGPGKGSLWHDLYMNYTLFVRWMLGKPESSVELGSYSHSTVGIGHGPEFVTVGHNPYIPNLGDSATHIVLPSYGSRRKFVD